MKTTTKLKCAAYLRVSSDKQDVENSIDRQARACAEWAERNRHRLLASPRFVDEARSGASMIARPAFQQLMAVLRDPAPVPFDAVLVDDDSRLDRGGHMAAIVEAFQARGVRLVSVDSGRDLTEESERLLVHVKAGINEQYLRELARRTRRGLASKVLAGYHAGGRIYGYRLVPEWPEGLAPEKRDRENRLGTRVEVDEEQAAVVRRIFDEYLRGEGLRSVASRLNREGVRSSRGGSWDQSGVRVVLTNPKYVGTWDWCRRKFAKTPETLLTEAEKERARRNGRHPRRSVLRASEDLVRRQDEALRIVDAETWSKVRALFAGRSRPRKGDRGYRRTRHPVAGLLRCECGATLAIASSTSKGHTYQRLACPWHVNRGEAVCGNGTSVRIESVVLPIAQFLREHLGAPARVATAVKALNRKLAELWGAGASAARAEAARAEVARLDREVANLLDAVERAPASSALLARLEDRERRLADARARLEQETRNAPSGPAPRVDAEEVLTRLSNLWEDVARMDDRAARALERVFDGPLVARPLDGDWSKGWSLEMRERPFAEVFSEGASRLRLQLVAGAGFEPATFGL